MSDCKEGVPHEYGPSTVGHGEAQCKWCHGTNRENAIIAPNHCKRRAQAMAETNESVEAGVLAMDMAELKPTDELIKKLEALEAPDFDVFCEVLRFLHPQPVLQCCVIGDKWQLKKNRFLGLIGQEAWESAAIMLVPEGWHYEIKSAGLSSSEPCVINPFACIASKSVCKTSFANHPAIALLICILKAKENDDG